MQTRFASTNAPYVSHYSTVPSGRAAKYFAGHCGGRAFDGGYPQLELATGPDQNGWQRTTLLDP